MEPSSLRRIVPPSLPTRRGTARSRRRNAHGRSGFGSADSPQGDGAARMPFVPQRRIGPTRTPRNLASSSALTRRSWSSLNSRPMSTAYTTPLGMGGSRWSLDFKELWCGLGRLPQVVGEPEGGVQVGADARGRTVRLGAAVAHHVADDFGSTGPRGAENLSGDLVGYFACLPEAEMK